MKDYEIFIIWDSAKKHEEEIIDLIREKFKIIRTVSVKWSKNRFTENLTTFYETDLRLNVEQIRMRGNDTFKVVLVEDDNPYFCIRKLSRGLEDVNEKVYELKEHIRKSITGKANVHASLNRKECQNNLIKLFGLTIEEIMELSDTDLNEYSNDCIGVGGWKSIRDVFKVLNNCFEYVVLRGGDNLIDDYNFEIDGDIDLLVNDLPRLAMVLQPSLERKNNYCFINWLDILGERIPIHIKYVGDNYYDEKWQRKILNNRKWNGNVYVPDDEMLFWSLVYHGLFHKNNYMKYEKVLSNISKSLNIPFSDKSGEMIKYLSAWMRDKEYKCSLHLDGPSAALNYKNIPEDLLDTNRKFYVYKVDYEGRSIKTLIVCNELIRVNPVLFTELVKEYDPLYRIEDHLLPKHTDLYSELYKRAEDGEYVWRNTIRNSGISSMVFSCKENGMFHKHYISEQKKDHINEVDFLCEEPSKYIDGRTVDYSIILKTITSSKEATYEEIKLFIEKVFLKYSIDEEYLSGYAWDMLSHNCIKNGEQYCFFDYEAKSKEIIKKNIYIAYEIKHLKEIGVFDYESKEVYEKLCRDFRLNVGEYGAIVNDRLMAEREITKYKPEIDRVVYSRYIDIPMESIEVGNPSILAEKILLAKANGCWGEYFTANKIEKVVIYGLGKYGKIVLGQIEDESVEIVTCCDLNVKEYKNYNVVNDIFDIPSYDLMIVAILNGEEIKKNLEKHNFRNVITIEDVLNKMNIY